MGALELIEINLLSPAVLAFVLGATATLLRSDLRFPDAVSSILSIYLLLAIGLKGGVELSRTTPGEFWAPCLAALFLGIAIPLWCYAALRRLGRFDVPNAAALAAHYGSVSAVTFTAGGRDRQERHPSGRRAADQLSRGRRGPRQGGSLLRDPVSGCADSVSPGSWNPESRRGPADSSPKRTATRPSSQPASASSSASRRG